MAHHNRKVDEQMAQHILLDDPSFLKEIVEKVLQELLEAEMSEHVGSRPLRAKREAHRAAQRLQAEGFENQGGHAEPTRPQGP